MIRIINAALSYFLTTDQADRFKMANRTRFEKVVWALKVIPSLSDESLQLKDLVWHCEKGYGIVCLSATGVVIQYAPNGITGYTSDLSGWMLVVRNYDD